VIVHLDLATRTASLEEADDCGRFHLSAEGEGDLAGALATAGVGRADADDPDGHAWVAVAAVRRLAEGQVGPSWDADFDAMLAYAATKGWLDDDATHVRAHVERAAADG
jgi:hypothetical protein